MKDDNTARACYAGYILKALADIQDDVKNIRGWNRICPILDEESKLLIEQCYWAIENVKKKANDRVMERYSTLIFPNDKIDWEGVEKEYEKVRRD